MSIRSRDTQSIHDSPINFSMSKQQYTIPKAQRFRKSRSLASYKYYDLPPTNTFRSTTFGVSNRKNLFNNDKSIPPPGQYNPKSSTTEIRNLSFAKGRQVHLDKEEECKASSFLKPIDNPGPGTYNPNPEFVDSVPSSKYSMRMKTVQTLPEVSKYPGPGKYDIKTAWLEKEKILSKDKKSGAPLIRLTTEKKLKTLLDIPFYNPKVNSKGEEPFHKYTFSIGKSERFTQRIKTENPGPGTEYFFHYLSNRFSEFV